MKWRPLVLLALLIGGSHAVCPVPALSQTASAAVPDNVVEAHRQAIDAAGSDREKALLRKELGDVFRLRGDIPGAGEQYGIALSLYRGFPAEDRIMMARYLSWSGRIDPAIGELNAVLSEDPGNVDARVHLARCLAWKGDLGGSLKESSRVLAESPGNRDALLARANALKWSGNPNAAIRIYKGILETGEDFDTRLALSQTYLAAGFLRGAKEGAERLKPEYPYQQAERNGLAAEIDNASRPAVSLGYSYYSDSDDNRLNRYSVAGGFWTGNWRLGLGYGHVDARDPSRHVRDDELAVSADSKLAEWLSVGGTAGVNQTADGDSREFFVWSARSVAGMMDGKIGIGAARKVFAETAELIEDQIRYTEVSSFFEYPLPRRFAFRAGYSYKGYSDDNHSNDVQGTLRYTFDGKNPVVSLAYQARYLDFRRETNGGYFDPSGFVSHLVSLAVSMEKGWFYAYLEPLTGHQSFRFQGSQERDWVWGGSGVIGGKWAGGSSLELHGEGGDYAAGSAAGYNYYVVGVRINKRF